MYTTAASDYTWATSMEYHQSQSWKQLHLTTGPHLNSNLRGPHASHIPIMQPSQFDISQ